MGGKKRRTRKGRGKEYEEEGREVGRKVGSDERRGRLRRLNLQLLNGVACSVLLRRGTEFSRRVWSLRS